MFLKENWILGAVAAIGSGFCGWCVYNLYANQVGGCEDEDWESESTVGRYLYHSYGLFGDLKKVGELLPASTLSFHKRCTEICYKHCKETVSIILRL